MHWRHDSSQELSRFYVFLIVTICDCFSRSIKPVASLAWYRNKKYVVRLSGRDRSRPPYFETLYLFFVIMLYNKVIIYLQSMYVQFIIYLCTVEISQRLPLQGMSNKHLSDQAFAFINGICRIPRWSQSKKTTPPIPPVDAVKGDEGITPRDEQQYPSTEYSTPIMRSPIRSPSVVLIKQI